MPQAGSANEMVPMEATEIANNSHFSDFAAHCELPYVTWVGQLEQLPNVLFCHATQLAYSIDHTTAVA
jgi:hypothetical protein